MYWVPALSVRSAYCSTIVLTFEKYESVRIRIWIRGFSESCFRSIFFLMKAYQETEHSARPDIKCPMFFPFFSLSPDYRFRIRIRIPNYFSYNPDPQHWCQIIPVFRIRDFLISIRTTSLRILLFSTEALKINKNKYFLKVFLAYYLLYVHLYQTSKISKH
jgi:hypothetical protein